MTTPERAASIVGDLAERTEGRAVVFWRFVMQTALRQAWAQAAEHPSDLLRFALRAIAAEVGIAALWFIPLLLAPLVILEVAWAGFHVAFPHWIQTLACALFGLFVLVKAGGWIARRYPGRELAVVLGSVAVQRAVSLATARFDPNAAGPLRSSLAAAALDIAVLLAGVARQRARSMRIA